MDHTLTGELYNMKKYLNLFLFLLCKWSHCQIVEWDSLAKNNLGNYDIYFIGEQHGYNNSEIIEAKLIERIHTKNTTVLLEGPYDRNFGLNKIFINKDTSLYPFNSFNPSKTNLLRYLYYNHIPLKLTDVVLFKYFYKDEIVEVLNKKGINNPLEDDISNFYRIGNLKFPNKKKNRNLYLNYLDTYRTKKSIYDTLLGSDSTKIEECFNALEASINAKQDPRTGSGLWSDFRETFMCSMIVKEIKNPASSKIISINGADHCFLQNKVKGVKSGNGRGPLAYRIKSAFPDKKVCSILVWNRKEGLLFSYFPVESRFILKNTKPGKIYIINVDYPGTPFVNLVGRFTHVVVY